MSPLPIVLILSLSLAAATAALANPSPPANTPVPPPTDTETLLIVGEQPGPGMWKVSRGNNVLWIVGTQMPVPQNMVWRAKSLKAVIAQSQEVLGEPAISVSMKQIGYFTALTMLPSAMEARKSPDNAMLKDIVPPDLYPRWLLLRDKYVDQYNTDSEDADIERWRPMFAALHLYSKAIRKSGLTNTNPVWPVINESAKKHRVKITELKLEPPVNNARSALKEFRANRLADLDCFAKTIARIETDLDAMRSRARAWAVGDVDQLRRLPVSDQRAACQEAITNASFVKTLGAQNIPAQLETLWLTSAETALAKNAVTVAVLPIAQLVTPEGYLAKLRQKGYVVTEPETE